MTHAFLIVYENSLILVTNLTPNNDHSQSIPSGRNRVKVRDRLTIKMQGRNHGGRVDWVATPFRTAHPKKKYNTWKNKRKYVGPKKYRNTFQEFVVLQSPIRPFLNRHVLGQTQDSL